MSVTPGSVLRVLNISLCKQRNSRLTQRSASCGIRNLIFDVDRARPGRPVIQRGNSVEVRREVSLSLLDYLSSIGRSELMEESRAEVVVNLQMMVGDAQWLAGWLAGWHTSQQLTDSITIFISQQSDLVSVCLQENYNLLTQSLTIF